MTCRSFHAQPYTCFSRPEHKHNVTPSHIPYFPVAYVHIRQIHQSYLPRPRLSRTCPRRYCSFGRCRLLHRRDTFLATSINRSLLNVSVALLFQWGRACLLLLLLLLIVPNTLCVIILLVFISVRLLFSLRVWSLLLLGFLPLRFRALSLITSLL